MNPLDHNNNKSTMWSGFIKRINTGIAPRQQMFRINNRRIHSWTQTRFDLFSNSSTRCLECFLCQFNFALPVSIPFAKPSKSSRDGLERRNDSISKLIIILFSDKKMGRHLHHSVHSSYWLKEHRRDMNQWRSWSNIWEKGLWLWYTLHLLLEQFLVILEEEFIVDFPRQFVTSKSQQNFFVYWLATEDS